MRELAHQELGVLSPGLQLRNADFRNYRIPGACNLDSFAFRQGVLSHVHLRQELGCAISGNAVGEGVNNQG